MRPFAFEIGNRVLHQSNQRGAMTTTTAVLMLVTLGTTAAVAVTQVDRAMMVSTEYMRHTRALMLAEAAVEASMAHLDTVPDWTNRDPSKGTVLTLPVKNYIAETVGDPEKPDHVWADIQNDLYDPGGPNNDTNGLILIKAYGQAAGSDYIENIETLYWRPDFQMPPAAGVVVCGRDILDAGYGALTISGLNHDLPPEGCTGSNCNAVENHETPDVAGVSFEVPGQERNADFPRTTIGRPDIAVAPCFLRGRGNLCDRSRALVRNSRRLVGMEIRTGHDWPVGAKQTYGTVEPCPPGQTREADHCGPVFVRVPRGEQLFLTGNKQGAGVLIVEGSLINRGTFTWTGLIFVAPGALLDLKGTYNIFGSVITAGAYNSNTTASNEPFVLGSVGSPARIEMDGNASINWAANAVRVGPVNQPGLMNSWREWR